MKALSGVTHAFTKTLPIGTLGLWLIGVRTAEAQWFENFDTYATGSQIHLQGGWQGWNLSAAAGALVSQDAAYNAPNSIKITGASDLVHRYFDYFSGLWVYSARQYIPSSVTSGTSYFILLNTYNDNGPYDWSVQTAFNLQAGTVSEEISSSITLPIVRNQWVEVRYLIDLTAGTVKCSYNGTVFATHPWHDLTGANALAAVDLFAHGTGPVYYDNLLLTSPYLHVDFGAYLVRDSKPSGAPHHGINRGAAWLASSTDTNPLPVTRHGVMQFASAERDQILVPWDADFNTTQGAITFWIRSSGITPGGNEGAIIMDRRPPPGDVIVQDDLGVIFWQPNGLYGAHTTHTVSDGNWHHVAYVFNQALGATVWVYIDGVLDTVAPANPQAWSWGEQQIEIGLSHDSYWRVFNGELDDLRFYKRQLSAAEVAQIYVGDSTLVGASDLAGRYNFDAPPSGMRLNLTWSVGSLKSAPTVAGPWSIVTGAVSPYQVFDPTGTRFYRLDL